MGSIIEIALWNDKHTSKLFRIVNAPTPPGGEGAVCPKCKAASVIGAIVVQDDGAHVIASSDELDPDLVCTTCGYWWD